MCLHVASMFMGVLVSGLYKQKDAAKKSAFFCIRYFSKTKSNPAKKTTEQCVSGKTKPTWQNSAIFEHFQK